VKGQLIFELDPEIPIIDSILKNMQAVQEEDILKPINFTKISQVYFFFLFSFFSKKN